MAKTRHRDLRAIHIKREAAQVSISRSMDKQNGDIHNEVLLRLKKEENSCRNKDEP